MPVRAPAAAAMTAEAERGLRRVLLAIVAIGALGLIAELFLLEHFDEWQQWLPLAVLVAIVATCVPLWLRPGGATVKLFRALMIVSIATGALGVWLHFAGNRAFELEMEATQQGWLLAWRSLRGATPALAPGAMVQLGLIGLALTWRHPALDNERTEESR